MRTFAGAISAPRLPRTEVVVQSFGGLFCGARLNAGSGRDVSVRPLSFLKPRLFRQAAGEGQRIWVGSRVERELQELEWSRRDRQYILGREFKASY